MNKRENSYKRLWAVACNFLKLTVKEVKLTAAEKLTVLLATAAVVVVLAMLSLLVVCFLSLALVFWLADVMPLPLAFAIVGVFYIIIGAVVFMLRRQIVIDPVARFISRLFLM